MAEPKYRGYSGKSDALKTAIAASNTYAKDYVKQADERAAEEEKKLRKEAAQRLKEQYKKEGKKEDGTNKNLGDYIGELAAGAGDLGSRVVGGLQQSAGNLADVALMGGNALEDVAAGIRGDSPEERARINARYEAARGGIKNAKTVRGDSLNAREDFQFSGDLTRDIADLAGRSLSTGLDATMFANPASLAAGAIKREGGRQVAKEVVRDAALYGGLDATATGAETYGQTGDLGRSLQEGAISGGVSALTQGGLDIGGRVLGKGVSKLRGKDAVEAPTSGPEGQRALPMGTVAETPQKRLGESTEQYDARIAELDAEAERIRNGDYSGLTDPKKVNAGKKGTTVTTQDPKMIQRQTQAASAAREAEAEIDRLNKMKLASPFHRQLDKINAAKQTELDQLDQMEASGEFPPEAIAQARAEVDARYQPDIDRITQKYPQDAMGAPALEESLRNVTMQRMDAEVELQRAIDEEMNAVSKIGAADTIEQPDAKKIMGRLQEIDQEKAAMAERKAQAEYRRSTYGDLEGTQKELADLNSGNFTPESNPELFNEDGSQNTQARIKRVKELREQGTETKTRTTLLDEVGTGKASKIAETNPEVEQALNTELNDIDSLLVDANPDYKPGIGAWASSTARVYEKAGLSKVLNVVRDGHDKMVKRNNEMAEQLQTWWKDIGRDKATSENIGRWLNGESVSLGDEALRVAKEMKAYYRQAADELGLDPESRISDYLPHIFDDKGRADKMSALRQKIDDPETSPQARAAAERQFKKLQEEFLKTADPDFQRIIAKNPGSDVNFGNLKSREYNAEGFSYDAFKVLDTYSRRANNKIYMEPGLQAMQAAQREVSEKMATYLGKHMNLIKNNGEARSELTEALDTTLQKAGFKPGSFERGSNIARSLVYNGTLGGNVGSAIRNSTQMTNTYAKAGEKYTAIGQAQAIQALSNKGMQQELKNAGIFQDTLTQSLTEGGESTFKTGVAKGAENAQKALWLMFDTTEKLNRAGAYYAGKNKALAAGKSEAEAVQAGKDLARQTQFNATVVDNPIGFSGPVAKNFLQLASYNIKQVEFIKDLVVGSEGFFKKQKDGSYQLSSQGALNLARFVGGSAANLAILGPLVGLTATQMVPFLQEFGEGEIYQSPLVQIALGKDNSKTGIANIISGKDKYGEDANRLDIATSFFGDTAPVLIPGGVQAKKVLDNERNQDLGYSATDSGNIRFMTDPNNTFDRYKGSVLGQYTTDRGQEYINNMNNKDEEGNRTGGSLTKTQSEKIKSAPENERPEMEVFYRAAKSVTGRDAANDKITKLFQEGQPEKARRLAAEFNAKVDSKMAKYYAAYPDMDEDLLDELNSNIYIKLTPRGEKQRAK